MASMRATKKSGKLLKGRATSSVSKKRRADAACSSRVLITSDKFSLTQPNFPVSALLTPQILPHASAARKKMRSSRPKRRQP